MQRIEIIIGGGKVNLKTEGFTGDECLKATEPFKRALGGGATDEHTEEYHEGQACNIQRQGAV